MLEKMKISDFDAINIMIEKSFPKHEIRGYGPQKKLLDDPNFNIYVIRDEKSEQVKAFITIWDVEDFGFVDHFAVSEEFRNEGLGSIILSETRKLINRKMFFEVDLPKDEMSKRRIGFYERNGYFLNDFQYELPPLVEGLEPMTMMIMSSDEKLTKEKLTSLKNELMKIVYK